MLAGRRAEEAEPEPEECLIVEAEAGAPQETVAQHQLQLKYGEVSAAAKWLAHESNMAHKV